MEIYITPFSMALIFNHAEQVIILTQQEIITTYVHHRCLYFLAVPTSVAIILFFTG
jgi:hypothetical protein